jgi:hypothetical protein
VVRKNTQTESRDLSHHRDRSSEAPGAQASGVSRSISFIRKDDPKGIYLVLDDQAPQILISAFEEKIAKYPGDLQRAAKFTLITRRHHKETLPPALVAQICAELSGFLYREKHPGLPASGDAGS